MKVHYKMFEQSDFDIGRAGMTGDYNNANIFFPVQTSVEQMGRDKNSSISRLISKLR